ncbi:Glycosyl transferase, group 2 family protein [Leifsonia rubra CMS 76R]|nr:Glycosyl transferase, group 2 family protein [Leifsonia rubra CMS 76R]
MTTLISGMGIVVPARNEEALLPRALAALEATCDALREKLGPQTPRVRTILVLDSCTDRSASVAAQWNRVETLTVDYGAVGAARHHGIHHLLTSSDMSESELWIANTDADSQVPANWLGDQWELAAAGVDVMIGTVRPDFNDLSEAQRDRWLRTHTPGHANGHVHGANLGVRADRYRAVGGFTPVVEHEDVLLVESLSEAGAQIAATDSCCVLTSGRAFGRTPGGYASHLRERL